MISKITYRLNQIRSLGFMETFKRSKNRFLREKRYRFFKKILNNKQAIEIGGSSSMFNSDNVLPIYKILKSVDSVNFSNNTIWEGSIKEGNNFIYDTNRKGYQYILDAVNLGKLGTDYELLISCNNLEHIANPIKALKNWTKVIKNNGLILLILPKKESNFDHKRPITKFTHLIEDFNNNIGEEDLTHLDEILSLHDLTRDLLAGSYDEFKERSLKNIENRSLHHHVFDLNLLEDIFNYLNIELIHKDQTERDYLILGKVFK